MAILAFQKPEKVIMLEILTLNFKSCRDCAIYPISYHIPPVKTRNGGVNFL